MTLKIYKLINFLLIFTSLILIFICYNNFDISFIQNIFPFISFLYTNHNSKLLYSITLENNVNECTIQNGIPLLIYNYSGTYSGCLKDDKILENGTCSLIDMIFYKYKNIKETEEKKFYKIFNKIICAHSKEFDYKNYKENLTNDDNYKNCGNISTIGEKLIILKNEECPINEIIINNHEKSQDKVKYKTIKFNNTLFLHYSNCAIDDNAKNIELLNTNSFLISNNIPCINPKEKNTVHNEYILDKCNKSYTCSTEIDKIKYDNRYKELIKVKKDELFFNNDINLDEFPLYSYKNENLTLYKIPYIGIKDKTSFYNSYSPINQNQKINSFYNLNYVNKILIRIYSTIFLIMTFSILFKRLIFDDIIFYFFYLFILLLSVILIISIISYNKIFYIKKFNEFEIDIILSKQLKYINEINSLAKNNSKKLVTCIIILLIENSILILINKFLFNKPKQYIYCANNIKNYDSNKFIKKFSNDKKYLPIDDERELSITNIE